MSNQHSIYRFSLTQFLVAVTVVGLAFTGVAKFYAFKCEQIALISKIESLSGFASEIDVYGTPLQIRFDVDLGLPNSRRINDSDGAFLTTLKTANGIDLSYTAITDEMIGHLSELEDLEWLNIEKTQITHSAIHELQLALPNCEVYHDNNPMPRLGTRRSIQVMPSETSAID